MHSDCLEGVYKIKIISLDKKLNFWEIKPFRRMVKHVHI